jgi:APA family basic amino acid/polyamine antiporter
MKTDLEEKMPQTSPYARKATGMVREVPLIDLLAFNLAGPGGIALLLVIGLFYIFGSFPGANVVLDLVLAIPIVGFVWVAFALLASVFPKTGGDYVFGSRVLHPVVGLASNVGVFASTILAAGFYVTLIPTEFAGGPALAVIGVTTGNDWWINAAATIQEHGWQIAIGLGLTFLIALLSAYRTRVLMRVMTICLAVSYVGFLVAFLILLFKSHSSFVNQLNDFSRPFTHSRDTYQATIDAGSELGVVGGGHSFRSTMGGLYVATLAMVLVWWGVYMSGEVKGGGQRRRQLTAIVGAGCLQGILIILATLVFIKTIGYDFFAAANAGAYGVEVPPTYNFFAAVVANSNIVAALLGLAFLTAVLPALNINFAMCQRALFAWSFDGLLPHRVAAVNPRTNTPVTAIVIVAIGTIACGVFAVFGTNFLTVLTITAGLLFLPMFTTGLCAVLLPRRRPELYRGSPADWHPWGVPILQVAGWGCIAFSLLFITLLTWFHTELGIKNAIVIPALVPASFLVAGVWYGIARWLQRERGVDLDLAYATIPPD